MNRLPIGSLFRTITSIYHRTSPSAPFTSNHVLASCNGLQSKLGRPRAMFKVTPCRNFATKVVPFNLSDIGEGIREVAVKEWYVELGQKVAQFDSICEVQSDKASVTITSKFDGIITKLYHEVDAIALVGHPLIDIEIVADDSDVEQASSSPSSSLSIRSSASSPLDCYKKTQATPAVRRIASENQVNLKDVTGTGRDGRVTKDDVLEFVRTKSSPSTSQSFSPAVSPTIMSPISRPEPVTSGQETRQKVGPITKAMIRTMSEALAIPHLGLGDDVDVTELVQMKSFIKSYSEKQEVTITLLSFMMKAASLALHQFPLLNASLSPNEGDGEVILKHDHNIGFAMDTPAGLIVPNVKRVQDLSVVEVASEINRMQKLGQSGQLAISDLSHGTFTLSNVGSIGGTFGIPVILPPQVAIGAIGKIRKVPVFDDNNQVTLRHQLTIVWSADHRIVDGATITRFNNLWASYLKHPMHMMMEMK